MIEDAATDAFPLFEVHTQVENARVRATVLFSASVPEGIQVAFYLMRDRAPVWRGGYGTDLQANFEVDEAGTYAVKAFVTRHAEKRTHTSRPFAISNTAVLETVGDEQGSPPKLCFTPLNYPHQDIALLSYPAADRRRIDPAIQSFVSMADLEHRQWSSSNGLVDVVAPRAARTKDGNSVMSGLARTPDRLVVGAKDLENTEPQAIHESVGDFTLASSHDWGAEVRTDYFGVGRIYVYESPTLTCISNRYHLLLELLVAAGADLAINRVKARANLQAVNQPFTQNFSTDMEVAGCQAIRAGTILELRGMSVTSRPSDIAGILGEPTNKDVPRTEYRKRVNRAAEEIVDNLRVAIAHPSYRSVRVDVTGGMDARLVFAALSYLNPPRNRVSIHTADVPGSPFDLSISLALTSRTGFEYDTLPRETERLSSATSLLENLSYNLGIYFGVRPEVARTVLPDTLRINGFYGEISARPYFARQVFGRHLEQLDIGDFSQTFVHGIAKSQRPLPHDQELSSLFRDEMEQLPGSDPAARIDAFYLYYRNGLHCSDRWLNHVMAPGWGPLQSKELFALKWTTFTKSKNIRLQMDVTAALDMELARLPIGRTEDNRDRARIDPRYHVPQDGIAEALDITEGDFRRYEEAKRKRATSTSRKGAAQAQGITVRNSRFADTHKLWVLYAITALHEVHAILSEREAEHLTTYVKDEFAFALPSARLSPQGTVIANKVLSLYYQCAIIANLQSEGR